jgi:Xaa-Pro dipeptidase
MKNWVAEAQKHLCELKIDGWLLYDFHQMNDLALAFLKIPENMLASRRFFYWIPARGEPVKIVHAIESHLLDHLPGEKKIYLKWELLGKLLKETLHGGKRVAMEYSPRNAIPYLSKVDGGIIDLVRECGVEVVSSGPFLQYFTCVWDEEQFRLHLEAAHVLDETARRTWDWVREKLTHNQQITEYDVQQKILHEIHQGGCIMHGAPICGVNAHSADPHYIPTRESATVIKKGDFILIDLWCKRDVPRAVYADITRVAVAASAPTEKQNQIFHIVRAAQQAATDYVAARFAKKERVLGCEVDRACRDVIEKAGYGEFFTHRTGHNIHTDVHGPGAHIDSLETLDERPLIPRTCFSVEPGIYLPGEFGVRLEYDIYIGSDGKTQVTGGIEDKLVTLF